MYTKCSQIEKIGDSCIPVVFAADDAFFINMVVSLQSLLCNMSQENCYDVVVLTSDMHRGHEAMLHDMTAGKSNVSLRIYDISHLESVYGIKEMETGRRLSIATYYRFFIPELMRDYDKVLYLDGDTVVMEDVALIFDHDISRHYAAAVKDYNIIRDMSPSFARYVSQVLKMPDPSQYFNAGVMLLNLVRIREHFDTAAFFDFARGARMKHHDQDVFNSMFCGRILFLNARYNVMWLNRAFYEDLPDCDAIIHDPAVIHYAGGLKPFSRNGAFREAASSYWKYAVKTPYYRFIKEAFENDCQASLRRCKRDRLRLLRHQILRFFSMGRRRRHYGEKVENLKRSLALTKAIASGAVPPWVQ